MPSSAPTAAYIIAARRTALGRLGGLHRSRRIEELTAPVIAAALADAHLQPEQVDEILIGSAAEGGNPARTIALAAGLPERAPATTIDRQEASGLDAILAACRIIATGDAEVVVAGGADSPSTAPWRLAKPRNLHQLPQFLNIEPSPSAPDTEPEPLEHAETLWRRLGLSRASQDAWTLRSHLKAQTARDARGFVGEIVPLRANAEEARDQSAIEPDMADLERQSPFLRQDGTQTPANTSAMHDGAAIAVVVSAKVWEELGRPHAMRLVASAAQGVPFEAEPLAPIEAMKRLLERLAAFGPKDIALVELSEASAAQALAFADSLGLDDAIINPDGGAVVRGRPYGASGAILVVRLFTRMVRRRAEPKPHLGIAALGARGGLGLAALFEAV